MLKELIDRAKAEGCYEEVASLMADAEFEFPSPTLEPSSMTDASKRRMLHYPEATEPDLAGTDADRLASSMQPKKSPASYKLELPEGIRDIDHWGLTMLKVGKLAKEDLCYDDLMSSANPAHVSYCTYLLSQSGRMDLTPPMCDVCCYVYVRHQMQSSSGSVFPNSTLRREFKKK